MVAIGRRRVHVRPGQGGFPLSPCRSPRDRGGERRFLRAPAPAPGRRSDRRLRSRAVRRSLPDRGREGGLRPPARKSGSANPRLSSRARLKREFKQSRPEATCPPRVVGWELDQDQRRSGHSATVPRSRRQRTGFLPPVPQTQGMRPTCGGLENRRTMALRSRRAAQSARLRSRSKTEGSSATTSASTTSSSSPPPPARGTARVASACRRLKCARRCRFDSRAMRM